VLQGRYTNFGEIFWSPDTQARTQITREGWGGCDELGGRVGAGHPPRASHLDVIGGLLCLFHPNAYQREQTIGSHKCQMFVMAAICVQDEKTWNNR
jgi:hypothetical protein